MLTTSKGCHVHRHVKRMQLAHIHCPELLGPTCSTPFQSAKPPNPSLLLSFCLGVHGMYPAVQQLRPAARRAISADATCGPVHMCSLINASTHPLATPALLTESSKTPTPKVPLCLFGPVVSAATPQATFICVPESSKTRVCVAHAKCSNSLIQLHPRIAASAGS